MSLSVDSCRATIAARNEDLRAVLHVLKKPLQEAKEGPLAGVPYVLKDVWDTAGIPTTGVAHSFAMPGQDVEWGIFAFPIDAQKNLRQQTPYALRVACNDQLCQK